jgi:sugar phosphate isomerase/epimerase
VEHRGDADGCKVPGAGDFDLAGLLRTLVEIGVRAPASVEILSPVFWQASVGARARQSYEGTRALLDAARFPRHHA